jgi:hypothetical protein
MRLVATLSVRLFASATTSSIRRNGESCLTNTQESSMSMRQN